MNSTVVVIVSEQYKGFDEYPPKVAFWDGRVGFGTKIRIIQANRIGGTEQSKQN